MILVFILLGIAIFSILLISMIIFSTIRIEIKDFKISNVKCKHNRSNIKISLYLANCIKWIVIKIDKEKLIKFIEKRPNLKIDFKKMENKFKLEDIKVLKKLQVKLSYLDLQAELGTEDAIVTAFVTASVSTFISILLPHISKYKVNSVTNIIEKLKKKGYAQKYQYKITPIYQNKNLYKINLNCIIELKMVHIINVIYILIKKGKSDENERTTSNRKSYGYSYE